MEASKILNEAVLNAERSEKTSNKAFEEQKAALQSQISCLQTQLEEVSSVAKSLPSFAHSSSIVEVCSLSWKTA